MADPFYDMLFPPLPLEEAAEAFLSLKTAGFRMPDEDDRLLAEAIKTAAAPVVRDVAVIERMKLAYRMFKKADEGEVEVGGTAIAPPSPPMAPPVPEFMEAEQAGREVEEQQASQYYAERLRQKAEELGILQQQVEELQQTGDAATQQLQTMQETQGVADQATQTAKQMALENAQQANMAAEQAMAQTMQATADATQAKLQLQQMRATLLQLAGQDPGIAGMGSPGPVPGAGQGAPGTPVMGAPGEQPQDPNAPAGAGAADPSQAGGAGGTEASSAPSSGASGPSSAGGAGASPATQQSGGSTAGSTDSSKVQVKVGSKLAAHPALLGGLLGGAAGAGLAGMEAAGHGPDPETQRAKIEGLEQGSHQPGLKGFAQSFELAKERALQTLGTATREHPALATLAGGAMGAAVGAQAGPQIAKGLGEAASYYKRASLASGQVSGLLGG